jgi:membrane-bound serine protease (ClpP class)
MTTLAASLFFAIGVIIAFARYLPRLPVLNRMMLAPPEQLEADAGEDQESADEPEAPYQELLGQRGTTTTPLRPSGHMKFEGRMYDVVAQGDFIEAGQPVEVIEIHHNRIVVRAAPRH